MTAATGALPAHAELDPAEITARSGSNFLAGFICLDAARREAMTVVYAFCRVVDDAVDDAPDVETGARWLGFWSEQLEAAVERRAMSPVGVALQRSMERFGVPAQPLRDLIEAARRTSSPRGPRTRPRSSSTATGSRRRSGSRACRSSAQTARGGVASRSPWGTRCSSPTSCEICAGTRRSAGSTSRRRGWTSSGSTAKRCSGVPSQGPTVRVEA